ncbi:MAG: OmpH family outer membrane protein [Paludibacteraceae bacterium]|nr:OmpH family outer membrane protein [Paludibacteraceae bacterium]
MKKIFALVAVVATVFSLSSCNNKKKDSKTENTDTTEVSVTDTIDTDTVVFTGAEPLQKAQVVYVDLDTVIKAYNLAKELEKELKSKESKARASIVRKQESLQKKAMDFQKDYENGKFLTEASLKAAQSELMKGEQELNQLDQKLTNEMLAETNKMNARLRDSLNSVLKQYMDEGRYEIIIANNALASTVLMAKPGLNITKIVVEDMNKRYTK